MGTKKSWEYISQTATTTTHSWTNQQVAQFNYFNPNGLLTKWNRMCETITQYVNADIIPSGWHLAYGSLSDFNANHIREYGMAKRVNGIKLQVALESLERDIEKGYTLLCLEILGEK